MTRTDQLRLCTWVESDPVSLTQMNENFTTLDAACARAAACADAACVTAAGLLLHARHAGLDTGFAMRMATGDMTRVADAQAYSGVWFSEQGARLPTPGYGGETQTIRTESGSSVVVHSGNSPVKLCSFQPSAYGRLNRITLNTVNNFGGTFTDTLKLYSGGRLVAPASLDAAGADTKVFVFNFHDLLDPNQIYELYLETTNTNSRVVQTVQIEASPVTYATGEVITPPVWLPEGCGEVRVQLYAAGTLAAVQYRQEEGAWKTAGQLGRAPAVSQTGAACTRCGYRLSVYGDADVQLRLPLPSADSVLYGYSLAML